MSMEKEFKRFLEEQQGCAILKDPRKYFLAGKGGHAIFFDVLGSRFFPNQNRYVFLLSKEYCLEEVEQVSKIGKELAERGVNIVPILGYQQCKAGPLFMEAGLGDSNKTVIALAESFIEGKSLAFSGPHNPEKWSRIIETPSEHIEKLFSDTKELICADLAIDLSNKGANIIQNREGYWFIDVHCPVGESKRHVEQICCTGKTDAYYKVWQALVGERPLEKDGDLPLYEQAKSKVENILRQSDFDRIEMLGLIERVNEPTYDDVWAASHFEGNYWDDLPKY